MVLVPVVPELVRAAVEQVVQAGQPSREWRRSVIAFSKSSIELKDW